MKQTTGILWFVSAIRAWHWKPCFHGQIGLHSAGELQIETGEWLTKTWTIGMTRGTSLGEEVLILKVEYCLIYMTSCNKAFHKLESLLIMSRHEHVAYKHTNITLQCGKNVLKSNLVVHSPCWDKPNRIGEGYTRSQMPNNVQEGKNMCVRNFSQKLFLSEKSHRYGCILHFYRWSACNLLVTVKTLFSATMLYIHEPNLMKCCEITRRYPAR